MSFLYKYISPIKFLLWCPYFCCVFARSSFLAKLFRCQYSRFSELLRVISRPHSAWVVGSALTETALAAEELFNQAPEGFYPMANGTTVHQNNGPVAKRLGQETVHSIGNPSNMLGDGGVGVLSQTIIPSTTIRWILPARIRHPDHNDVIFVSESFVQLREFLPTRHLADIPARLDLGCRILAAKVISYVDATPFADQVVKQEERYEEDWKLDMPPQILVLALDFCEIAFVYAEDLARNHIKFRVARKKLPADVSSLGQYGRHLAVDSM